MAKGDLLQQLLTPEMMQQLQQGYAAAHDPNRVQTFGEPTGNPWNFMAGLRKTMGNPNPVSPYGWQPPNQRNPMPAPNMNMPAHNTGFAGNQNTGITGGMNRTYAPSSPMTPSFDMGMKSSPVQFSSGGTSGFNLSSGQTNNPYAPKSALGQMKFGGM